MRSMDHLVGVRLPPLSLPSTAGGKIGLAELSSGPLVVVYLYPGDETTSGSSSTQLSSCAVQRASFREYALDFAAQGAKIAGLSSERLTAQLAIARREHLPYPLLSDGECELAQSLELPTFVDLGVRRYRRLTLICEQDVVRAALYPVSPKRSAAQALEWLQGGGRDGKSGRPIEPR